MEIFVKLCNGKIISFQVSRFDNIKDVKERIYSKINIETGQQKLVFEDKILEDEMSLLNSHIPSGSQLNLFVKNKIEIFIEKAPSKRIPLQVEPSDTIAVVKDKFMSKHDLLYSGEELNNNKSLSDYMVKDQSILHLISKAENRDLIIYVVLVSGSQLSIIAKAFDTVLGLKQKIERNVGIIPEDQRIIFSGRKLEDNSILSKCGIKMYSKVFLFTRLVGE